MEKEGQDVVQELTFKNDTTLLDEISLRVTRKEMSESIVKHVRW